MLSCLLPTLCNVKVINFFLATLIGIIPQIFLSVSIGSGLEKIVDELNNGDNERRGIVRLRSDCFIAFKNKRAEKRLIKIKINPGKI